MYILQVKYLSSSDICIVLCIYNGYINSHCCRAIVVVILVLELVLVAVVIVVVVVVVVVVVIATVFEIAVIIVKALFHPLWK